MAVYSVEGKLGTGKTKFCVWRAQQALLQGRRVASNVDLVLENLTPTRRSRYIRLPDKPTLESMGHGNPESYDEDRNGVLILDELGSWLNARSFQDKNRLPFIDWMIHARKHGWDVYFICQDQGQIDKQVRDSLIEYQCKCMRMDKVKIPFIGAILGTFVERWAYLPKFHMVTARVGQGMSAFVAERWRFLGKDLHSSYDTRQVFRDNYPHGAHCYLQPWDWEPAERPLQRLKRRIRQALEGPPRPKALHRPKRPEIEALMQLPPDQRIAAAKHLHSAAPRRLSYSVGDTVAACGTSSSC